MSQRLAFLITITVVLLASSMVAFAQETVGIGKRLSHSELSSAVQTNRFDGYSYVTGRPFEVFLEADGTAVFIAPGAENTAAMWSITNNQLCFLYEGASSWSCRTGYQTSDGEGIVLVNDSQAQVVAVSRLLPHRKVTSDSAPASQVSPRSSSFGTNSDDACSISNGQPMNREELSEYLNNKSYEGVTWGNSGRVYSIQQNLERIDYRRAIMRVRALDSGFEGDVFINNDTGQLCQFFTKPTLRMMTCFESFRLANTCPFDIALFDSSDGQLAAAYFDPIPLSDAPPIEVYESQETQTTRMPSLGDAVVAGMALAVTWDQFFASSTSAPLSQSELSSLPQSTCEREVDSRMLYCSDRAEYGLYNTTYYLECDGRRSENRSCRGLFRYESSYGFGDDYYCDPETQTKGPSRNAVISELCR